MEANYSAVPSLMLNSSYSGCSFDLNPAIVRNKINKSTELLRGELFWASGPLREVLLTARELCLRIQESELVKVAYKRVFCLHGRTIC